MKKLLVVAALVSSLAFGEEAKRTPEKRATIIGTAAAAGAAIGAAVAKDNRVKGAIIGAAVGGAAGFIYDQMTKKKAQQADKSAPDKIVPPATKFGDLLGSVEPGRLAEEADRVATVIEGQST